MLIDEIESSKESHGELGRTLSPAEQKNVLGGFEDPGSSGCATSQCSVYDGSTGTTYYGDCGYVPIPGQPPPTAYCECDRTRVLHVATGQDAFMHCTLAN